MADKIALASIASFQNDTSAAAAYNSNNALLTTALDNTLSRDGTSPNQMSNNLDMNNNQILNLPAPATVNSPARLIDVVSNPTITVPPTGTSGATVPLLNASNTWTSGTTQTFGNVSVAGTTALTGVATFTAAPVFTANTIAGASLVTNSVTNTQLRQGVARSVVGVTGNATANVADIQGTTRQVLAVNTAGTAVAFAQPQGDQLLGSVTNDSASAGNVGEYIESVIPSGSAVALTSGNNTNITSISLTAGDWDVDGVVTILGSATTVTLFGVTTSFSTTSLTPDFTAGRAAFMYGGGATMTTANGFLSVSAPVPLGSRRFSLGSTTTIFLVANAVAAGTGTISGYGILRARRAR